MVRVHPAVPRLAPQARKVAEDDPFPVSRPRRRAGDPGAKPKETSLVGSVQTIEVTSSYGFAPSTAITLYFAYCSPILRAASYSGE